jgi:hypothetical protein
MSTKSRASEPEDFQKQARATEDDVEGHGHNAQRKATEDDVEGHGHNAQRKATEDDVEGHGHNAQRKATEDEADAEGHMFLASPSLNQEMARARERDIQRNLKAHSTKDEARPHKK